MATKFFGTISLVIIILAAPAAVADPFATTVYDSSGLVEGYDATTTLGSPTTSVYDSWEAADMDVSMVYGAWGTDNVALFAPGGHVIVQFDTPVVNNPLNPYGADFTLPMNPNLTPEQFGGLTAVEALALYGGSGGGTAFDIGQLGLDEISFIRVDGPGVIDAFAKVSPVPEPATAAILLMGAAGIFIRRRNRK